jgi:hypothetical protein
VGPTGPTCFPGARPSTIDSATGQGDLPQVVRPPGTLRLDQAGLGAQVHLAGADPRSPLTGTNTRRRANRARGLRPAGVVASRWTPGSQSAAGRGACRATARNAARAGAARGRAAGGVAGAAGRSASGRQVGRVDTVIAASGLDDDRVRTTSRLSAGCAGVRCGAASSDHCTRDQAPGEPSSERSPYWIMSQGEVSWWQSRLAHRGQRPQASCRPAERTD